MKLLKWMLLLKIKSSIYLDHDQDRFSPSLVSWSYSRMWNAESRIIAALWSHLAWSPNSSEMKLLDIKQKLGLCHTLKWNRQRPAPPCRRLLDHHWHGQRRQPRLSFLLHPHSISSPFHPSPHCSTTQATSCWPTCQRWRWVTMAASMNQTHWHTWMTTKSASICPMLYFFMQEFKRCAKPVGGDLNTTKTCCLASTTEESALPAIPGAQTDRPQWAPHLPTRPSHRWPPCSWASGWLSQIFHILLFQRHLQSPRASGQTLWVPCQQAHHYAPTQISIENMCTYVMKFNVRMFPRHNFSDVRMFSYRGVCFQNIVYLLVVIHRFRMCHTPSSWVTNYVRWRIEDAPRRTPYWLLKTYAARFHVKCTYVTKGVLQM